MTSTRIGLRYERLLFLAGPLTLLCAFIFFLAFASEKQEDRFKAKCFLSAESAIDGNLIKLRASWARMTDDVLKGRGVQTGYQMDVFKVLHIELETVCSTLVESYLNYKSLRPEEIQSNLQNLADKIKPTVWSYYGVEVPDVISISFFGTPMKMTLSTLSMTIQLSIAPLLILWLGSLYHTRYRESMQNADAIEIGGVFPHVINVYFVGMIRTPRKKSWVEYYAPYVNKFLISLTRCILVLMFVGPSVILYVLSLYYQHSTNFLYAYGALGIVVSLFAFANLIAEFFPWHVFKSFSIDYRNDLARSPLRVRT